MSATKDEPGRLFAGRRWIPAIAVRRMLGIGPETLTMLAKQRRITVMSVPGSSPRYLAADADRILKESIVNAAS